MTPILQVENLNVTFSSDSGDVLAVNDTSFAVEEGKTLGIVGESGCGKSVSAFSILRLIEPPGRINSGKIMFRGTDLLSLSDEKMRAVRGREISMIFQEPMTSLNPVFTAGFQIGEAVGRNDSNLSREDINRRCIELLHTVGIPSPEKRINSYPHEFSGGMRQRIMIAMALAASPALLIADEPTTALDVTIQAQILDLLLKIQQSQNMSMIIISHDLGIVANTADHVAIMYAGEVVEYAETADLFNSPAHPYTRGLFESIPVIGSGREKLATIKGSVPIVREKPDRCLFYDRCPKASEECTRGRIQLTAYGNRKRMVRCIKA